MRSASDNTKQREIINAKESQHCYIPLPFDQDVEIEWTPVWSLTHKVIVTSRLNTATLLPFTGEPKLLCRLPPTAMPPAIRGRGHLARFLGVIERDSVALWWYNCLGALLWISRVSTNPTS